jgi:hypothetical protein
MNTHTHWCWRGHHAWECPCLEPDWLNYLCTGCEPEARGEQRQGELFPAQEGGAAR